MTLRLETKQRVELIDITSSIKPSIPDGILLVYTQHTTTGIFVNENDRELLKDVEKLLSQLVPRGNWEHDAEEGNADSHMRGILLGHSVVIPITDGKLDLGTWQRVFFYEGDGPRSRKVIIKEIKS